jgi:predicted dehydrogenase
MLDKGPERWHPNPEAFYQAGSGPMLDMGPYYTTALVTMLGPVRRVTGFARASFSERIIHKGPRAGTHFPVNTPTYVAGVMEFASGAIGTLITSFDVQGHRLPYIEIYGSEGTIVAPDPNQFGGPVYLCQSGKRVWQEIALTHGYTSNVRGIGVADMLYAIHTGRPHRANGKLAYHVLDIMQAFYESSRAGKHIELSSTCQRPAPLRPGIHSWEDEENAEKVGNEG